MDIVQDTLNFQSAPFLTDAQINFDTLDNITLNQKLESIFYNLIYNNTDIKLIPKINNTKNLLILFEFFFNKLNDIATIANVIEKKNDIFKYLSETLIKNLENITEKNDQEKIAQYFYNLNFFEIMIQTLNEQDISLFKEKFALFINVSINLYLFFFEQIFQNVLHENLEINNIFKNKIINELFDQYDAITGMNIDDNVFKLLSFGKSQDILDKIKFIQNELKKNSKINIINLSSYIQDLMQKRNLEQKENKYSEYNDVKENLFNILSKEEIDDEQKNNKELIKMDKDIDNNKMEIETNPLAQNEEIEKLLMGNTQEEKKEEQLTGKKRTRDKKKKDKDKDKDKDKEDDNNNNKKKNKKRKINNKENENNNINNNKGVKKEKEEALKKRKPKRNAKENSKKINEDALKNFLDNFHAKNDKNNLRKKSPNSNLRKTARKKESQSQLDSQKDNNNRTQKKIDSKKNPNKLIEDILKREFELGSKITKQKVHIRNKQTNQVQNKDKQEDKGKGDDKDKNSDNNNSIINTNNKQNPKIKKKAKKKYINTTPLIIDEELKKSTPIRNLKKHPKSILKKINLVPNPPIQSATPIKFQKAKSSEKKLTLSSESKNKKFRTFAEIFQSPSKLKATPLKRRVHSEKKSNLKINNILTEGEKEEKKNADGKKRNISFNNERIVKEYNPKTPVRDVKQRITRKSPLERKNRNDLIN